MPVVRGARPLVVAGEVGLDRDVRWVHSSELPDIATLLRGGELVLTTGSLWSSDEAAQVAFVASLADVEAAGLVVELHRRWSAGLPAGVVRACAAHGLPLVALGREVRFAAIAQAVGERIVDGQLTELRAVERIHTTFTRLSLAEAEVPEILQAAHRIAGLPVVLESDEHHVVAFAADPTGDDAELLADWPEISRLVGAPGPADAAESSDGAEPARPAEHTGLSATVEATTTALTSTAELTATAGSTRWDASVGWLVAPVGAGKRRWGRLVIVTAQPPGDRLVVLAERAAAAVALRRLNDRDRDGLVRRSHHEIMLALAVRPTADALRRCELAGLPLRRRRFVAVALRPTAGADIGDVVAAVVHATRTRRLPALVSQIGPDVHALLSLPATNVPGGANVPGGPHAPGGAVDATVDGLAADVRRRHAVVVAASRPVNEPARLGATLAEARQVLESVGDTSGADPARVVHRLDDVHVRGLIALLGTDPRLAAFVDRELAGLRAHDARWSTDLVGAVRALLAHPTSKASAAASIHLSRPAFYARLEKAEQVIGASLDDPEIRTSLHLALLAHDVAAARPNTAVRPPRPG
ncbi:hypothetical protein ACG83_28140 [Frankia sp. R43]|nr:hypothetical protein ACG83_28140 [Frankia sp. R43]